MTLGAIIKEYRDKHDMSMDDFARLSGISKAYISLLEKDKHPKTGKPIAPSIKVIKQAAQAMQVDFDTLFSQIDGDVRLLPPPPFGNSSHPDPDLSLQYHYYNNKDAADAAQFLFDNPEYKVLFDASKNVKKEDIDKVAKMIRVMTNNDD